MAVKQMSSNVHVQCTCRPIHLSCVCMLGSVHGLHLSFVCMLGSVHSLDMQLVCFGGQVVHIPWHIAQVVCPCMQSP